MDAMTEKSRNQKITQRHLVELLQARGVDLQTTKVRVMRHADKRYPLYKYIGTHALKLYQALQQEKFEPGSLIVSFFGTPGSKGLLLGVWKVLECLPLEVAEANELLAGSFEPEGKRGPYFHVLGETPILSDLRLRLEAEWQGGAINWLRVLNDVKTEFPIFLKQECPVPYEGLETTSLVMAALRMIIDDIGWRQELSATAGIYLITDELTGEHYVGSACGGAGIWQRWADYARNGHGGNRELIALLQGSSGRENHFRFTLLQALPLGISQKVAIERENFWKVAIGSRTHGLNCN